MAKVYAYFVFQCVSSALQRDKKIVDMSSLLVCIVALSDNCRRELARYTNPSRSLSAQKPFSVRTTTCGELRSECAFTLLKNQMT